MPGKKTMRSYTCIDCKTVRQAEVSSFRPLPLRCKPCNDKANTWRLR